MRIKHIYISEYKNLKDFTIDFDGDSFVDVFVGKNGTGKSNFLEALIEIFRHLFEEDHDLGFSYKLKYELESDDIFIHWDWDNNLWRGVDSQIVDKILDVKLPENILLYYSGHNPRKSQLLRTYEETHRTRLNDNRTNVNLLSSVTRKFSKIDSDYKTILLTVLLLQDRNNKSRQFIMDKLMIESIDNEIRLDFTRPEYAIGKSGIIFDEFDSDKRFWSPKGYFKALLDEIWNVDSIVNFSARKEGKITEDDYILYRSFESFQRVFDGYNPLDLFIAFDNLKAIGYLKDIRLNITLKNGSTINIDQLSDGQFQTIYIYALTELYKDKNCITLLDEPDSFLHPEWQNQFFSHIDDISSESSCTNHVLMTSHSAVTLIKHSSTTINYFDFESDGLGVNVYNLPKKVAIGKLSDELIKYTEHDQVLRIIETIQFESKPVLFTEGKTDCLIIKEAWGQLYPDEPMPFVPFYAFGHRFVCQVMKDPEVIREMNGLPMFGLFDFDKGFNSWNGFSKINIESDVHLGLVKQIKNNPEWFSDKVYALMLPVPQNIVIKRQVINTRTNIHWGGNSLMAIENLFMDEPDMEVYFTIDTSRPDEFKKFIGDKVNFAENIVPSLSRGCFEVFKPMFDFIKSKIQ